MPYFIAIGINIMKYCDVKLKYANEIAEALKEFAPDIVCKIFDEDYALYQMGLSSDILCKLEIITTSERIEKLLDDIVDLEICAFDNSGRKRYSKDEIEAQELFYKVQVLEFLNPSDYE